MAEKTARVVQEQTAWATIIRADGTIEDRCVGFYSRNPIRMWLWEHNHVTLALLGLPTHVGGAMGPAPVSGD